MIPLHEGENILSVNRRAWFVFASTAASAFVGALLPMFLLNFISRSFAIALAQPPFLNLAVFSYLVWLALVWLVFFAAFVNYYFDVFIVTSERVIHMAQHGFFHREISELRLSRVQDVTVSVRGILATLFRFGDIRVETAGHVPEFSFSFLSHPYRIKDLIMQAHRQHLNAEHTTGHDGPLHGGR